MNIQLVMPESQNEQNLTMKMVTPELGEIQTELNLHKFEQLEMYTVRDLDCGIPARIHPHAQDISRLTVRWLQDHEMDTLFTEKAFRRFADMDCARVLSMTHPDSPMMGTLWIAKLTTMFFVADDFFESQYGESEVDTLNPLFIEWHMVMLWSFPRDLEYMIAKLMVLCTDYPEYRKWIKDLSDKVVAEAQKQPFGTAYPEKVSPCASGLRDLWQEAITVMPKNWSLRLASSFHSYFTWHIRETFNRKQKRVPTIEEYVTHRTGSGGMQMLLGPGADYVDRNPEIAPEEVVDSPQVKHLLDMANLGSCLFNDIYSFPKELRNGEFHNMVFLISYWQQCSYNEAGERVLQMVETTNRDIIATIEEISRTTSPQHRAALEPTIQACINSIPAHNVFHKTSCRYSFHFRRTHGGFLKD